MAESTETRDRSVRHAVYTLTVMNGRVPLRAEVARTLEIAEDGVAESFEHLAEGRALVLQEDGEILMAAPFSAVPTPFLVEADRGAWWANCIWDALGVPVALDDDARITAACGCCGSRMTVEVRDQALHAGDGVIHFAVPARDWWNDIVFT